MLFSPIPHVNIFLETQLELRKTCFRRGLVSRYFLAQLREALADSGVSVLNACNSFGLFSMLLAQVWHGLQGVEEVSPEGRICSLAKHAFLYG